MARPPWQFARMLRGMLEFLIVLAIAVQMFRTWLVEAYRVPSGSMASALLGLHVDAVCDECGFRFPIGAADTVPERVVCPNCGFTGINPSALSVARGDRLLVFKGAYALRDPRRWEVAVFRSPLHAAQAYVKRVVGLPGETVQITQGELYINGQLARKSLRQAKALRVLVHDAAYESPDLPAHWQANVAPTRWLAQQGRFVFTAPATARQPEATPSLANLDWLTFRNLRRAATAEGAVEEAPLADRVAYNTQTRRIEEINYVTDILLSFRVVTVGDGRLALRATDGREQFDVVIEPAGKRALLYHNGQLVTESTASTELLRQSTRVDLALVDRQVLVSLDGQPLLAPYPFEPTPLRPATTPTRPLSIGAEGLAVEVTHLQVWRDVYYTDPGRIYAGIAGAPKYWGLGEPYTLGPDEFFVLGDNSGYSDDSRMWRGGPAVKSDLLIGQPMVVHLPYRAAEVVPGFQVPDFERIRYIK